MNKLFVFMMLWTMSCLTTLAQAPMDGRHVEFKTFE